MGGYVFGLLGRAPERGDKVEDGALRFKVLDVEGTRIERLEVEFRPMLEGRHDEAESAAAAEG
jgi:CBS domain containing-hemolysin-like protein